MDAEYIRTYMRMYRLYLLHILYMFLKYIPCNTYCTNWTNCTVHIVHNVFTLRHITYTLYNTYNANCTYRAVPGITNGEYNFPPTPKGNRVYWQVLAFVLAIYVLVPKPHLRLDNFTAHLLFCVAVVVAVFF